MMFRGESPVTAADEKLIAEWRQYRPKAASNLRAIRFGCLLALYSTDTSLVTIINLSKDEIIEGSDRAELETTLTDFLGVKVEIFCDWKESWQPETTQG